MHLWQTNPPAGWEREQVSHLAHEAREAKIKAAAEKGAKLQAKRLKELLYNNQFVIALILFNFAVGYTYFEMFRPI
jgi:hypothetical protein